MSKNCGTITKDVTCAPEKKWVKKEQKKIQSNNGWEISKISDRQWNIRSRKLRQYQKSKYYKSYNQAYHIQTAENLKKKRGGISLKKQEDGDILHIEGHG